MDICSNTAKLASEDLKNFHELAVNPSKLTCCGFTGGLPVNDLGNDLSKFLNLQDEKNLVSGSIPVCGGNKGVGKVDICEDSHPLSMSTSGKFLSKSATFPCSNNVISPTAAITCENEEKAGDRVDDISSEQNGYIKSDTAPSRSLSLPTPLKLVSALKGSREKHGVPPKKLMVTWAPDVYDPTPTAVSHVVTNKSQRHRNDSKRNSKNKQKGAGKSSRGSRGKDKKQGRKYGGNSSRCFKSLDDNKRIVDQDFLGQHQADIVDYNIGNPDPYCGTSFLKNSVSKLHFSVAEAT